MSKRNFHRGSFWLALLLLCGLLCGTFVSLTPAVYAEAESGDGDSPDLTPAAANDKKVRIGLMFGTAVTVGFETTTTAGYSIGVQVISGDSYDFTPLWSVPDKLVSVVCDGNLSKKNRTYSFASASAKVAVGGYHVAVNLSVSSEEELRALIDEKNALLETVGAYAFPAYYKGGYQLRIGSYSSLNDAVGCVMACAGFFPGSDFTIAEPSATAVTLVNPETDRILFEFDGLDGEETLGLCPLEDGSDAVYMKTPASNIYKGVFAYTRYRSGSVDGIGVTNVLTLDDYVTGVLPYEIGASWNQEALKTFAIVIRTYTLANLNRHYYSYGFDICNASHCQVYKGEKSVTEAVRGAVEDTGGMVVSYEKQLASVFYSSSLGGVSAKASEVWTGRDLPYLVAQLTPWEKYMEHPKAFWITEVSATELCKQLNTLGYPELKGAIASINIDEYCTDSTYVKTITISDTSGNSISLTGASKIRTLLANYLYSANFVVGKGSVQYTEEVFLPGTTPTYSAEAGKVISDRVDLSGVHLLSSIGTFFENLFSSESAGTVLTANGVETFTTAQGSVLRIRGEGENPYKVAEASSENHFIFVGKGWGHGVGMSQYGVKDLSDAGYGCEDIVKTYFVGTEVMQYQDLVQGPALPDVSEPSDEVLDGDSSAGGGEA